MNSNVRKASLKAMDWLFFKPPAETLVSLRIGFALILLYQLWDLYPVRHLLLGYSGLYPADSVKAFINAFNPLNVLYFVKNPHGINVWFWMSFFLVLCLAFGFFLKYQHYYLCFHCR